MIPEPTNGPLRFNPQNPRYFADRDGKPVLLRGSHTWANFQEMRCAGDPPFDNQAWLEMMSSYGHNFMRLWSWDHPDSVPWVDDPVTIDPMPFLRSGPAGAWDGGAKYDLYAYNPAYFERLRERILAAKERGIYTSLMLFEGFCTRWSTPQRDSWRSHPYNPLNNINGVDGDPDRDGRANVYSLDVPEALQAQKAYVAKVIDTVNDLDNVLYEIINEPVTGEKSIAWQYEVIRFIQEYQKQKPFQHPVGMTAEDAESDCAHLFASPADWISPGNNEKESYKYDPPAADGSKVIISDTDHLWGHGGNAIWAWKSFLRGMNLLFMDPWQPAVGHTPSGNPIERTNFRDYADWEPLRVALGNIAAYARRMDLNRSLPQDHLSSSTYCLAEPGVAYLCYIPIDKYCYLDLSEAEGEFQVEWFSPQSGETMPDKPVRGGRRAYLISPFGSNAVVFVWKNATR